MKQLLVKLRRDFPDIRFEAGNLAHWSPESNTVTYSNNLSGEITLLHELGHALCGHVSYASDIDLLRKEVQAWQKAQAIAAEYEVEILSDHVEDCLDTYRDWLHKRSTCPECGSHGLQRSKALYQCPNCQTHWQVSSARFCRPYRLKKALTAK
jgi:hypothetical protein